MSVQKTAVNPKHNTFDQTQCFKESDYLIICRLTIIKDIEETQPGPLFAFLSEKSTPDTRGLE